MKKLLLSIFALTAALAMNAEVTLFETDFTAWSAESIITATTTSATRTVNGTVISFKGYKTTDVTVDATNGLTFTSNNISASAGAATSANYYMAIPVVGVNGGTVTVTTTGDATKWYYSYDDGSNGTIVARAQASANGGFTISGLNSNKVTIYIGNNAKKIKTIKITTDDSSDGPTLESIAISGNMTKTAYYDDEAADFAGLSVTGIYSDESTAAVANGIEWSIEPALAIGTTAYVVTATVGELTATKNVMLSVTERPLPNPEEADLTEDGYLLLDYEHAAATPNGIFAMGSTAIKQVNIHTNTDKVYCIQLANGYNSSSVYTGNSIRLAVQGGFKAGDVVTIAGFFNNDDNTKESKAVIFTLEEENAISVLYTTGQFVNGRLVNDEPNEFTYTLTADADVLYIGRQGGTGTNIYTLKVVRPEAEPADPTTPFEEVWNAIEMHEELEVEFYGYVSAMDGDTDDLQHGTINWDVVENPLEATPSGAMKRIAAADAQKVIRVFDPVMLNTPGNEPGIGSRVLVTGTTWSNGISDGTIKAVDEKGWATSVENTEAEKAQKLFIDGQIVIVKDGVRYNAIGQKM